MIYRALRPLILASTSPRRRDYLQDLGIDFSICAAEINETPHQGEEPIAYVQRMALEKAGAGAYRYPASYILAADTAVCLGRSIFGKPASREHAVEMLMHLAGRTHQVHSAICLRCAALDLEEVASVTTDVTFMAFDRAVARNYVAEGESLDKAGAYGIQGKGAFLVARIEGSYSNVVGLPLAEALALLTRHRVVDPAAPDRCRRG